MDVRVALGFLVEPGPLVGVVQAPGGTDLAPATAAKIDSVSGNTRQNWSLLLVHSLVLLPEPLLGVSGHDVDVVVGLVLVLRLASFVSASSNCLLIFLCFFSAFVFFLLSRPVVAIDVAYVVRVGQARLVAISSSSFLMDLAQLQVFLITGSPCNDLR